MKPLRIVSHAINGVGVGHVTRLLAINRWIRRYAQALEIPLELYFLTSSESAISLFHAGIPAWKLPSWDVIVKTGMERQEYRSMAQQWTRSTLELLQPDLLIVDTVPGGSFGEFLPTAGHDPFSGIGKKAFIYRPVKMNTARERRFQEMLPRYDLIAVPEHKEAGQSTSPNTCGTRFDIWDR